MPNLIPLGFQAHLVMACLFSQTKKGMSAFFVPNFQIATFPSESPEAKQKGET